MPNNQQYQKQLTTKKNYLTQILQPFYAPNLEVFSSPHQHFRQRAEFKIWHQHNQISYAMFDKQTHQPIFLQQFWVASIRINQLMQQLQQEWNNPIISERLFQIEFMSSYATNDALITLCYHRPLDDIWQQTAKKLAHKLQVSIIGRWRKHKIVIGQDFITEQFCVNGKTYSYQQPEGSFSQPNAVICAQMLNWVTHNLGGQNTDVLELYCGNGNFTLPLADCALKVLATEINKNATTAAINNLQLNQISNVKLARLAAHEVKQALACERKFYRLREINLDDYNFGSIFVDPPRSGLDISTCKMAQQFAQIVYISCNPTSLQRDLTILNATHHITHCALFDQFPFTPHIETGVILKRR